MFLVDSHCHLDTLDFETQYKNIQQVLDNANKMNVKHMLSVAVTLEGSRSLQEWLAVYPEITLSCGAHPLNLDAEFTVETLFDYAQHAKVVGIGETGLDYYYSDHHSLEARIKQQAAFSAHIAVARSINKPLIIHTRQAKDDTLALLKSEQAQDCGGVLHCFTEDIAMARKLLDLGFYISFSGIITFKNAETLREVAKYVPLDRILIETDSPYLAPIPFRGKANEPKNVYYVAEFLSNLRKITLSELAQVTTNNFCDLFNINLIGNNLDLSS